MIVIVNDNNKWLGIFWTEELQVFENQLVTFNPDAHIEQVIWGGRKKDYDELVKRYQKQKIPSANWYIWEKTMIDEIWRLKGDIFELWRLLWKGSYHKDRIKIKKKKNQYLPIIYSLLDVLYPEKKQLAKYWETWENILEQVTQELCLEKEENVLDYIEATWDKDIRGKVVKLLGERRRKEKKYQKEIERMIKEISTNPISIQKIKNNELLNYIPFSLKPETPDAEIKYPELKYFRQLLGENEGRGSKDQIKKKIKKMKFDEKEMIKEIKSIWNTGNNIKKMEVRDRLNKIYKKHQSVLRATTWKEVLKYYDARLVKTTGDIRVVKIIGIKGD